MPKIGAMPESLPPGVQPSGPNRLSVVVIALNASDQIDACLASVAFADEILVVDSGSTDGTVEIARSRGAKVIHQPWLGFGPQKQFAVGQAVYDWVLCLDTDEQVTRELQMNIRNMLIAPGYRAYRMPRCNRFMGRWLRHGEGYPDWSLRMFDRRAARWSDDAVHEKVLTDQPVGELQGDLLHASGENLHAYLEKQNRYTTLQAEMLVRQGKRIHSGHLVLSPIFRFFKFYLGRRGFLDGVPGLVHIIIGCFNSFAKYAKALAMTRGEN